MSSFLYILAAGCFLDGMAVALDSVIYPYSEAHLEETWVLAKYFWQNMQFDMVFGAALVVVVWGLLRPDDLAGSRPYRWAAVCLVLLALSPLLALTDTLVRPLGKSQYVCRTISGLIMATIVGFVWAYAADLRARLPVLAVLRLPRPAGRFLVLACAMLLAIVPSDLFLTSTWASYLQTMRTTVLSHRGPIAFEDTPFSRRPDILLVENWALSTQSLALRSKVGDGIILPPKDFTEWVPFPPQDPPNIGRFFWRD